MSTQIPMSLVTPKLKSLTFKNIEQIITLGEVARKMQGENLSEEFVVAAIVLALRYEGVYDLLVMWSEETDSNLKDEIIADLQAEIDDESKKLLPASLEKKNYLHFDNLAAIAKDVKEFKKQLKIEIERWGGVSKLSRETGIPQASLSRFLNSASMPRRSTLEKIAKVMNLQDSKLLIEWLQS
jgi:DNA-binding phage protein